MTDLRANCGLAEHERLPNGRCCEREVRELADLYLSGLLDLPSARRMLGMD